MRFVDIAVAALIGSAAITGILAWDPRAGDAGSRSARLQADLRDRALRVLQQKGMVWLVRSPPSQLCSYFDALSNSTFGVSATVGSTPCGDPPKAGSVTARLTVNLDSAEVTIVAWSLD
jgi:hypothetical protein